MPGRNLLREREGVVKAQGATMYVLGWVCMILAIVAGAYASGTWVGSSIRFVFELMPGAWFISSLLFVGFILWIIDTFIIDLVPNQVFIPYGFLGPILAGSPEATGGLAPRITEWSALLQNTVGARISPFIGNVGASATAIVLMVTSGIIAKRTLDKHSSAAGGGRGGRG